MKDKISVLILFGGVSSEHEVSRASAAAILSHIDRDKYDIHTVGITKAGRWLLTSAAAADIENGSWETSASNKRALLSTDHSEHEVLIEEDDTFSRIGIDVVFPMLHGRNCEDGRMQGLLQIAGVPFVGSGTASSAASMDKAITKAMVEQAGGVRQADSFLLRRREYETDPERCEAELRQHFGDNFPLFVKPVNAGSSVGISKVKDASSLGEALRTAFREDDKVLTEEAIEGREIEVAVLGNDKPEASCIGEIFAANEFYDYNAKYENAASRTEIVRDLSQEKEREIRETAVRVYEIMGCRGLARADFFLQDDGRVVFNEINTLPGFTKISMYPQLWEASGIPYSSLIDELIRLALEDGARY